ncbi:MAG TPA: CheR family methyltransferase [Kofleriaceae bacterium]|nr:CheR family methyltransferase [Kofleriaceae bacterium]
MLGAGSDEHREAELDLLLESIRAGYGYDFTRYARGTLRRRLSHFLVKSKLDSLEMLRSAIAGDGALFAGLLDHLTVQVSEMFRDPEFYIALRRNVAPFLRTYGCLKLWIAGCASGEEAHSAVIVLHEEGLLARSIVYATDVSPEAVRRGREGIYPAERIRQYADSYHRAGGTGSFTSYFTVAHGYAAIRPCLTRNLHFAEHNLVCDEVFGEMNAILCRNVLIYFNRDLRDHALGLLGRSLGRGGFLCLGSRENLVLSGQGEGFEEVASGSKIYRRRFAFAGPPA